MHTERHRFRMPLFYFQFQAYGMFSIYHGQKIKQHIHAFVPLAYSWAEILSFPFDEEVTPFNHPEFTWKHVEQVYFASGTQLGLQVNGQSLQHLRCASLTVLMYCCNSDTTLSNCTLGCILTQDIKFAHEPMGHTLDKDLKCKLYSQRVT